MWEDPRELHKVVVHFKDTAPPADNVRLEYWGSRWPEQHLPKDREPGGGDNGWVELGNWYTYKWRVADTQTERETNAIIFTFRNVNAKEFPRLKDYDAPFRYTMKIRVTSDPLFPKIEAAEAFTDSVLAEHAAQLVWKAATTEPIQVQVFNGKLVGLTKESEKSSLIRFLATVNADPNTFDRTLVTVECGNRAFTFKWDDLAHGALFLPDFGVAVSPQGDARGYEAIAGEVKSRGTPTLYDRVAEMPEQTWRAAWEGIPSKKSKLYLPLGLDSGRQRFLLQPDGTVRFRLNDNYLQARPGRETARIKLEQGPVSFHFHPAIPPVSRTIEEESLPIGQTIWETNGVQIQQTAFVTQLGGMAIDEPVPAPDTGAVFLARFVLTNTTSSRQSASLPITYKVGGAAKPLRLDKDGFLWLGDNLRGQVSAEPSPGVELESIRWTWTLEAGQSTTLVIKIPYMVLTEQLEREALSKLDFEVEHRAVAGYWRRRLDESARLITPEPMLNEFYRAHAGHLLINCEGDPEDPSRRFARVGSFSYGAYGNESCMMVVDLDRRGYHKEAQQCLDAWLHYQGTVGLPGDFSTKKGILYGAGGLEAGGYNQHHGWILWMLAEHYRFTRDARWLRGAAPGILAAANWIITESRRTTDRDEFERGLLPAGSLEDIGDWWPWLSTSCYTWRGLDSAAWALEQAKHPEASRVRAEATVYHQHLVDNFRKASERSPVVRLRDGTAVPHIPSHVHRRGRCFGWICETLEGSLHLLITRAIDPRSREAEWILKDYEDNRYLSNQYGYNIDDFDRNWFSRGGMSMQACLLFDVEPYLYRDDVKNALRALFNAEAVSYFPDVRMNTEHALPSMGDSRGDHYKSSDEANACGWLRYLFVREEGDALIIGQAVPREWLGPGKRCGFERGATYFGEASIRYTGGEDEISATFDGLRRNPPREIRLRFREPKGRLAKKVTVNGKEWKNVTGDWVLLPGDIGKAIVRAKFVDSN